jgi:hypothetical protein
LLACDADLVAPSLRFTKVEVSHDGLDECLAHGAEAVGLGPFPPTSPGAADLISSIGWRQEVGRCFCDQSSPSDVGEWLFMVRAFVRVGGIVHLGPARAGGAQGIGTSPHMVVRV